MLKDPVTGFRYPPDWITACKEPVLLAEVARGFRVLASDGTLLRRGFSTGVAAAAAAKAAVLSLKGIPISGVDVLLPCRIRAVLPVRGEQGIGICHKDSGDHPSDVTAGMEFEAIAHPARDGIRWTAGEGIGRFVRATPRYTAGDPAISPPARDTVATAIREGLDGSGLSGVSIKLQVPRGREIAQKTLNSRVGVEGGISLLGTTGFVEPWDDHLTESFRDRIRHADRVVLTTGRTGLRYARILFPDHEAVLVGGRIGEALEEARGEVVLCGLPGLILRFVDPQILKGTSCRTIEELAEDPGYAFRILKSLASFHARHPRVRVVLIDRSGRVTGGSG